jgi:predicted ester cyclase
MKKNFFSPLLIAAVLMGGLIGCNKPSDSAETATSGTAENTEASGTDDTESRNKEVVEKLMQAYEKGDTATIGNYIEADIKDHTAMDPAKKGEQDLKGMKSELGAFHTAFPDGKLTVNHIVAEDDKVMVHTTFSGTNKASLMGMPVTNKSVKVDAVDVYQLKDGKVTEHWAVNDNLGFMVQLGLMPDPSAMPAADVKDQAATK